MALTVTKTLLAETPEHKMYRASCTFDASYPTGGETLDMTGVGRKVVAAWVESPGGAGYMIDIDRTNFASGTMLLEVFQGDNNNAADAPGVEVAATTDLSTLAGVDIIVLMENLQAV